MIKKSVKGVACLFLLSSLPAMAVDSVYQGEQSNNWATLVQTDMDDNFRNWVELVKDENPYLKCPITSSNESVCHHINKIHLYENDVGVRYEAELVSYNNEYVAIPSFSSEIPDMIITNGEETPFFIEKENGRNIPYIAPKEGKQYIEVLFSKTQPHLWFNNLVQSITINQIEYQANKENILISPYEQFQNNEDSLVSPEYTIFNGITYSNVPLFERYILLEPNNNRGILEIPLNTPENMSVFKVESIHSKTPVLYQDSTLFIELLESTSDDKVIRIVSRLNAEENQEDFSISVDGLDGQLIGFANRNTVVSGDYAGQLIGAEQLPRNTNIRTLVPNIPHHFLKFDRYYLASSDTVNIKGSQSVSRDSVDRFSSDISNIRTNYVADKNGIMVGETKAKVEGGVYQIQSGVTNITARLNGSPIPVEQDDQGNHSVIVEHGGELVVLADVSDNFIAGNIFTRFNLPSSLIVSDVSVNNANISSPSLVTPINKVDNIGGIPLQVAFLIVIIGILIYLITSSLILPFVFIISAYLTVNSILFSMISFLIGACIVVGVVIAILTIAGISGKKNNLGEILIFTGKKGLLSSILLVSLFSVVLTTDKLMNTYLDSYQTFKHYPSAVVSRSQGLMSHDAISEQSFGRAMVASERSIDISNWESPIGVKIPENQKNKEQTLRYSDVKKENIKGYYIGSHAPSVITWFIMLSLSLYILLNNIFKQMKKREGETNEKD